MSPALADPLALDVDGLGMYGLDARTLDLSEYVNDMSLEHLMSHQPGVSQKQEIQRPITNNNSFGAHVNPILHNNMARPPQRETSAPSTSMPKPVDNKPRRFMLDLESPPVDENEDKALHDMNNVQVHSQWIEFSVKCLHSLGLVMCI